MSERAEIELRIDGVPVRVPEGTTLLEAARRHGIDIPTLCHEPRLRPVGVCRMCVVDVGERTLTAACVRECESGMEVQTDGPEIESCRSTLTELLMADQPDPDQDARETGIGGNELLALARRYGAWGRRLPRGTGRPRDGSSPVINVDHGACILCDRCIRACDDVQSNEVIGRTGKGYATRIAFDLDVPMGESTCVSCGECVASCPTGALVDRPLAVKLRPREELDPVESVCPYCGIGCALTYWVDRKRRSIVFAEGRDSPGSHGRLCVKGRYGWDYAQHPQRLTRPLIRRDAFYPKGRRKRSRSWPSDSPRSAIDTVPRPWPASEVRNAPTRRPTCSRSFSGRAGAPTMWTTAHASAMRRVWPLCSRASEAEPSRRPTATFATPVSHSFIVIDPRRGEIADHADWYCRIKPGTDVAFYNAMMHVIVAEGLVDRAYVERRTEGFEAIRAMVERYPPEIASRICGVDAETIRRVAVEFGSARNAIIYWGMGISQHVYGTNNARCLIALALLTGNVGRPGSGLHPLRGQNNVQGASDAGLIPMVYPDYQSVADPDVRAKFERAWGRPLDARPGLTVVEIVAAALEGRIRGMYILGENPFLSDPNINKVRRALANLDFLVVQDIFLTETAEFADVILPASAYLEKLGTYTNTDRRVQIGRPVLEPPGEARLDWQIICKISSLMGYPMRYESPDEIFDEYTGLTTSYRTLRYENLGSTGKLWPNPDPEHEDGPVVLFEDRFPTPSGRARFVPAEWTAAPELPDEDYPLVLNTGRLLEHWHTGSMTRRSAALDAIEPEAFVGVHPEDARELGVEDGGRVRVTSRRGSVTLRARVTERERPGAVFIPFHFREAAANLLTLDDLDPDGKIPEFKFCAVRVEPLSRVAD
jgi:formate dehydrogenase major subunit